MKIAHLGWRLVQAALLSLSMGAAVPAWAVCAYTETGGQLGSANSFQVRNGPVAITSGSFALNCGSSLVTLGSPYLRGRIVSPTTGLTLKQANSNYRIPYQLTAPNGAPYTQGALIINLSGANLITLLASNGANLPLQIRVNPGANVPAGLYTDTITVNWDYANICQGLIGLGRLCVGISHSDNTNRTLTVQLLVTTDCSISAPDINFGSAPLPSAFPDVAQMLSVVCTRDVSYTVGLSPGSASAGNGRRQMSSGANRLAYNIFKPDGSVWGNSGTTRVNTGMADGLTSQMLPYTARVYADQPPAPVGSYQDAVIVDVQF